MCLITWSPVNNTQLDPDGHVLGYNVYVAFANSNSKPQVEKVEGRTSFNTTISGLEEFTQYNITIKAFNLYGEGNASKYSFCYTEEDGM